MLEVRNALLNSGTNLWQPRAMNVQALGQVLGKAGDDEVMRALEQLLVARHQVGVGEVLSHVTPQVLPVVVKNYRSCMLLFSLWRRTQNTS